MSYLKKVLEEKKLTQKELGIRSGIARESINRYCNGKKPKKLETYFALSQGTGIEIGKLIEGMHKDE